MGGKLVNRTGQELELLVVAHRTASDFRAPLSLVAWLSGKFSLRSYFPL